MALGLLAALAAGAGRAAAQTRIGQYEDEAPLRTWNAAPFTLASALGRGGTSFTFASDPSAGDSNPALLPLLPRFSAAVQGFYEAASVAKAGPIGTGVFLTNGNLSASQAGIDFLGVAVRAGRWGFAVGVRQEESYLRPGAAYEESAASASANGYAIAWSQTGSLRIVNAAFGVILGRGLSLGLGVNLVTGSLRRSLVEQVTGPGGYRISDLVTQDFGGLYLNGGLLWAPSSRFRAAAVIRTPYDRKSSARSALDYQAPDGNTDISIAASSQDIARQPLMVGVGGSTDLTASLTLALEASYFRWSAYALEYFGEAQDRPFRDVVRLSAGLEWKQTIPLFGTAFDMPTRIGLIYDPQPTTDPSSVYGDLTIGTGLAAGRFRLDLATLFGREWGSGNALVTRKIALSLVFQL